MDEKTFGDFDARESYKKLLIMVTELQHTLNNTTHALQLYDHRIDHLEDEVIRINDIINED